MLVTCLCRRLRKTFDENVAEIFFSTIFVSEKKFVCCCPLDSSIRPKVSDVLSFSIEPPIQSFKIGFVRARTVGVETCCNPSLRNESKAQQFRPKSGSSKVFFRQTCLHKITAGTCQSVVPSHLSHTGTRSFKRLSV